MMNAQKQWLSPKEVAAELSISKSSVYNAIRNNEIPHKRIGKRLIIPKSFLDKFEEELLN